MLKRLRVKQKPFSYSEYTDKGEHLKCDFTIFLATKMRKIDQLQKEVVTTNGSIIILYEKACSLRKPQPNITPCWCRKLKQLRRHPRRHFVWIKTACSQPAGKSMSFKESKKSKQTDQFAITATQK